MPTVRLIFTHDELHYRFGEPAAVAQEEAVKP